MQNENGKNKDKKMSFEEVLEMAELLNVKSKEFIDRIPDFPPYKMFRDSCIADFQKHLDQLNMKVNLVIKHDELNDRLESKKVKKQDSLEESLQDAAPTYSAYQTYIQEVRDSLVKNQKIFEEFLKEFPLQPEDTSVKGKSGHR